MMRVFTKVVALLACTMTAEAGNWQVTTDGLGPLKFGMTLDEAAEALQSKLAPLGIVDNPECYYVGLEPPVEGLVLMVSNDRVVRIDISTADIKTRSGLGIGDSEDHIMEVLGPAVEVEPHRYVAPEGHYMTAWSSISGAAVRFETYQNRVTSYYAGIPPYVTYVEGCS